MVNPVAWTQAGNNSVLAGAAQGINAIRGGQEDRRAQVASDLDKRKQDFENELGIKWQNMVEASYAISGAFAIGNKDIEAQNKLLTQAKDIMATTPDHPIAKGMDHLISLPAGKERDALLIETIDWLEKQGVYGKATAEANATGGGKVVKKQKTKAFTIINPKTGEQKVVIGSYNPETEEFELKEAQVPKGWELASDIGETPEDKKNRAVATAGGTKAAEAAVTKGAQFFDQYQQISESMLMLDKAEEEIDKALASPSGYTGTGVLAQYLPGINEGSIRIKNIGNQLGLEVIKSATFGALSEAEMSMAMQTGLPRGLTGPQLKQWIQDKRAAQQKLMDFYLEAASFIGAPRPDGNGVYTQNDWVQLQRAKTKEQKVAKAEGSLTGKESIEDLKTLWKNAK